MNFTDSTGLEDEKLMCFVRALCIYSNWITREAENTHYLYLTNKVLQSLSFRTLFLVGSSSASRFGLSYLENLTCVCDSLPVDQEVDDVLSTRVTYTTGPLFCIP